MRPLLKHVFVLLILLAIFPALINADFYVIPVIQKMKNVVTVAKSGGQFNDVKAAIDSITNASADNQYLVFIGPGVYTVTSPIQLKAHVTVMGSGRKATVLKGALSTEFKHSSAIFLGADNATLTQLQIVNTGSGGDYNIGIFNQSCSPVLDSITVDVSGNDYSNGISNISASPIMINITATASAGETATGVNNHGSSPTMIDITATASGGSYGYGIWNYNSLTTMRNCTLKGNTYSIYLYNYNSVSSIRIHNSNLEGSIGGCGDIFMANSIMNGGMEGSVTYHCFGNYGTSFQPVICP